MKMLTGQWMAKRFAAPSKLDMTLLGAAMTLGFAPFGLWPVAVLSLAGLWWLVRQAGSVRPVMMMSFLWGLGHGITALYWLPWAFFKDAGGSWSAAIGGGVPAVMGLAVFGAIPMIIACVAGWWIGRRFGWLSGGAVWAFLWVVFEFIKGLHPMGFPWLPAGAVFGTQLWMMQLASVGGVWLLSALLLTMAVMVSYWTRRGLLGAVVVSLLMALYGAGRVHMTPVAAMNEIVRVVQPNIQSAHKWDAQMRWNFLQETLSVALSGDLSTTVPRTIIMPETAVAFYVDEEDDVRNAIASRLAARMPSDGALVTGTVRREPDGISTRYFNSFTVMDVTGILRSMYDKRLLVPFGEYIPGRAWLEALPLPVTLRTMSQSRIDFTHGSRSPLLSTPAGVAVGLICYEGIFPLQVARAALQARYLANITNDGWFTGTIALYQHAALARLRAVETGLPMVRVANTGITVVYDGLGREVTRLPINTATYADVALPPAQSATPFLRFISSLF